MPEPNTSTTTDPQAGSGGTTNPQPQAGNPSTDPQAGAGQSQQQLSQADYERMIADLRRENASHRTKLKAFEDEEAKRQQATLSEQQKLEKKLADLQSQHDNALRASQERLIQYEVRLQAASLGIVDPDAATKLVDWAAIDYDDAGNPTNLDKLLKDLLKAKPYLAGRAASTSGGATNPGRTASGGGQPLSWDTIGKLTPEEYRTRRSEITAWIAKNPVPRH
jgi:hypothetical protein